MLAALVPWRYIAALIGFGAAFSLLWMAVESYDADQQQIGYSRAVNEYRAAKASADAVAIFNERRMIKTLQDAQNAAAERETKLRADYAAAHAAANGLRDTVATLRGRLADAPADASRATAAAAFDVFLDCTDQYRAVAEAADGHAADSQTLTDAWPK